MKDSLGDRMKSQYEDRTRYKLPRRTYTIIRLDGKAFHTLTRNCQRPFDAHFMGLMNITALKLCMSISNTRYAYVQSDEVSLLLTDFENIKTEQWFDGNIQKMVSVAASIATEAFNASSVYSLGAHFDARVFTIPDPIEVENYFIWRQKDATSNSIQMAAQALYSHSELEGMSCERLQDMMHAKGVNWNDYTAGEKRGRMIIKTEDGWKVVAPPIFTQDREFLSPNPTPAVPSVPTR